MLKDPRERGVEPDQLKTQLSRQPSGADGVTEIDNWLNRVNKQWALLKRSRQHWDFKTATLSLHALDQDLSTLSQHWGQQHQQIQQGIRQDQAFVQSDPYPPLVEAALKQAGIPLKGEFPNYEFPPFKLTFQPELTSVRLSMGRRSQQTYSLAVAQLVPWVNDQYRRVIESKFDPARFCRELLAAYELLNRLSLQVEDVLWGHPVPLKELYKLLTVRQSARQDYPEPLFTFDLARLQEQTDIQHEGYRFELVPSRQQASGLLLVNSRGQESRVSSLAIHRHE